MSTTWTGYKTTYVRATESRATKIKVMNLETGKSRLMAFDYEFGGGEPQHTNAVHQATAGSIVRIERCGQWEKGYYFVVERVEED